FEVLRRLRAAGRTVPTILLTAKGAEEDRVRGLETGADDYVTKPFDPYEFLAKIRVFLRLSFAEEVGQMKSTLITLLAHETRTPLAHILSSAQLLEDEGTFGSKEERNDLLGIILNGAQRLQTIFEKSMFLFQQQSGTIALERTRLELGAVVRSEIDRVQTRVTGVTLEYEGGDDIAIEGQEPLLRQALGILLEQAARRSPSTTPVRVRVESQEQDAVITVSDAGESPDADSLQHYFEIFSVSDIAHHSDALDLDRPICASIVRRHGGSIRATIPEEGGLSCSVVLPSEEDAKQVA
ncbi:MAG: response regulator, partial [Candidatus Eisenbacteria bacterium]|nr:response regulator [Candidatus Eisenbacteria bacterium]